MDLRELPISFRGELHDVRLVQFSLDPDEARSFLPEQLKPKIQNNRAVVSLVDVSLKKMRPAFLPSCVGISYRHLAFRFLVVDPLYSEDGKEHGIFFIQSFTRSASVASLAALLTYYRLGVAEIVDDGKEVVVKAERSLRYVLGQSSPTLYGDAFESWEEAGQVVGVIDRAYAVGRRGVVVTQVKRAEWPIEPLAVDEFSTDFFATARLECAFKVLRPVAYTWLAPRRVRV